MLKNLLFLFCLLPFLLIAQPERLAYFPYDPAGESVVALDPGDLLLAESVLLTNLFPSGNVSFSLSFDRKTWAKYGIGPHYSSFFSMKNQLGCYCVLITDYGSNNKVRKEYYLSRGRCYSVFWNQSEGCWDVQENRCRR